MAEAKTIGQEFIAGRRRAESGMRYKNSSMYQLKLAAAQLAISLAAEDTPLILIDQRLASSSQIAPEPYEVLSDAEIQRWPEAIAIVDAIHNAVKAELTNG